MIKLNPNIIKENALKKDNMIIKDKNKAKITFQKLLVAPSLETLFEKKLPNVNFNHFNIIYTL